jgi:hypothetical protein
MGFVYFAKTRGGGFGSEVALGGSKKFVADHELANRGGAQERREIMRVKMPGFMSLAVGGLVVETHGIGKSGFKKIVIANGDATKYLAEEVALA